MSDVPSTPFELIDSLDVEVLETKTFGSYQGDYAWLIKQNDLYGVVFAGYGSCASCDAWQAAVDYEFEPDVDLLKSLGDSLALDAYNSLKTPGSLLSKLNAQLRDPDGNVWWAYDQEIISWLQEAVVPFLKRQVKIIRVQNPQGQTPGFNM